MKIMRIGIDLAKNVFQIHGVDAHEHPVCRRQLRRHQLLAFFQKLEPCLIGMEACAGAHHWARQLQAMGHTVRLIAPQFVKAYVKGNKNDANDAEAICEAVSRPGMRFVPIKTIEQQDLQAFGNAKDFKRGRDLAAWLGLVPAQHSSGRKDRLLGISKRGNTYLRTLVIHGARAVVRAAATQTDRLSCWIQSLCARRNNNIAAVALANKTVRLVWALMTREADYDPDYGQAANTVA